MGVFNLVGLGLTGVLTVVGCALLWNNVNGVSRSTLSARYLTAAVFDYVYLFVFLLLAVLGQQITGVSGMVRVGLLGVASLVFLVHTDFANITDSQPFIGHGWAYCNAYRLAVEDNKSNILSLSDRDANRELLAGTVLGFLASLIALVSAIPAKEEGSKEKTKSKIAVFAYVVSAVIIIALSIAWWDSGLTSLPSPTTTAQGLVYVNSLTIISSMIIILVILALGLFLDVEEYVLVAAFFSSQMFCYVLSQGLRMLDLVRAASSADDMDSAKAGVTLFYIASFTLMISCAAYFAEKAEREHKPAIFNHLFLLAAILLIIPGAALLWHQCRGLGKNQNNSSSQFEVRANVAEVFGYVYVVLAAIGALMGTKLTKKPGMVTFFIVICASMLFTMSNTLGNFSWANGNIFREADMSDVQLAYGVERQYKQTLNNGDSDRQVAGGFTLVQLAGFFSLLSMIRPEEHTRNGVVIGLTVLSIAIFVACGIFEAAAPNNDVDQANIGTPNGSFVFGGAYYNTMRMVCNFFFMAFFVLLGFILGVREFVSLSVITMAVRGLQTLQQSFLIANTIDKTAGATGRDRVLVAGALGFICSLLVVAGAALYFSNNEP